MSLTVTSLGNAGVLWENGAGRVVVDAFFRPAPWVGGRPLWAAKTAPAADLLLVTHAHGDHFHPGEVAEWAARTGAVVAGPALATDALQKRLPAAKLVTLEPEEGVKPPASVAAQIGRVAVTAFRTDHSSGHNSYLGEMDGVRLLHDGDNEKNQPYDLVQLGRVDGLFLCPWQGSGAGAFVAKLRPGRWFLVHMTDEELDAHAKGEFLPGLVTPVPPGVVALRGGETFTL